MEVGSRTNSEGELKIEERYKKRVHYSIERPSSSKVNKIKKRLGYVCQACGFNYEKKYGKTVEKTDSHMKEGPTT